MALITMFHWCIFQRAASMGAYRSQNKAPRQRTIGTSLTGFIFCSIQILRMSRRKISLAIRLAHFATVGWIVVGIVARIAMKLKRPVFSGQGVWIVVATVQQQGHKFRPVAARPPCIGFQNSMRRPT